MIERIDVGSEPDAPPIAHEPLPPPLPRQIALRVTDPVDLEVDDESTVTTRRRAWFIIFTLAPGGLSSIVVHLVLLIALGVYALTETFGGNVLSVEMSLAAVEEAEDIMEQEVVIDIAPLPDEIAAEPLPDATVFELQAEASADSLVATNALDGTLLNIEQPMQSTLFTVGGGGGGSAGGSGRGATLAARAQRRRNALALGATPESEQAVDLGLKWIVDQQRADGSWRFANHGSPRGATGMALLALLGAGNTHLEGTYRASVDAGLRYLIHHQDGDGSYREPSGTMYSHGLATLALCEALAMTRYAERPQTSADDLQAFLDGNASSVDERGLMLAAQAALDYIARAQGPKGGWRYAPKQPGDTSVVGWQVMALKSGYLAGLDVNGAVISKSTNFLNHVSQDYAGSCYGYTSGGNKKKPIPEKTQVGATTPIGLLCRMYTGWGRDRQGITVGVSRLRHWARPKLGLYYYYYATQVMHHFGGAPWDEWNAWMRHHLVKNQKRNGKDAGSWVLPCWHGRGDRFYCTAMSVMTLEIYYRYAPIYGEEVVKTTPVAAANTLPANLDGLDRGLSN